MNSTTNIMADTKHHYTWRNEVYRFSLFIKDKNNKPDNSSDINAPNAKSSTDSIPFQNTSTSSKDKEEEAETIVIKKGISIIERSFWITILVFALISLTVVFMAFLNTKEISQSTGVDKPRTILDKYINQYFPSDKLKKNLLANQQEIQENLKKEMSLLNNTIDKEINNLFSVMEYRVDGYLNYHYSVTGEYSEIYAMASNKIDALIEEKLIGNDFSYKLQIASDNIHAQYEERIEEHLTLLNSLAFEDVDLDLAINQETINQLQGEIIKNQMIQEGKFSILIAGVMAKKIAVTIAAKIAAKASGKIATKGAIKIGTKMAGAASAGAMGLACGPVAMVCGVGFATFAWFATDAVIVTADEHLNRDKFRAEISSMISSQKYSIKRKLQTRYTKTFEVMSHSTQAKIAMTTVHEKRRMKVSN